MVSGLVVNFGLNIRIGPVRINFPTGPIIAFPQEFWYSVGLSFNLRSSPMTPCEFCSIISGDAPAEILLRNEHAIAILDIRPIHYGHVLVLPIRHVETFIDIPADECATLTGALQTVTRAIVKALRPPGFNVFSNNGKAAGQSVFHFHFHVTPRYPDDNIKFVLELKKYNHNEMSEYGGKIRDALAHSDISTQPSKNR